MTEPSLPPGPRTPGIIQAVLWGLRYPQFTAAAHRRFGRNVTIKPGTMQPLVLTSDRDAARRLLTGDPLTRAHANDVVRPLVGDGSLFLLEPGRHLRRRKLLLPPFHGERVGAYAELMESLMAAELERRRGAPSIAVLPVAQNVTIEVILRAVLGVADPELRGRLRELIDDVLFYPFGALRLRLGRGLPASKAPPQPLRELAAFAGSLPTPAVTTYFPQLKGRSRLNVITRRWWRHRDRLIALLDEQIAATRSDPELAERDDVLAMLVQARDEDGEGLSDPELHDDLIALIGAGHETTAAAIAWGATLLAHDPGVRERAETAAAEDDQPYMAALVKEVLRIRPPLPLAAARTLSEPFALDGRLIPAGTPILIDAWGIHHDPGLYPEPERLRPERFLDQKTEPYAWLPFGGGARRCLGAALAELEVRIGLGVLLRETNLRPAERTLAPMARRGITLIPHGGGRVCVA